MTTRRDISGDLGPWQIKHIEHFEPKGSLQALLFMARDRAAENLTDAWGGVPLWSTPSDCRTPNPGDFSRCRDRRVRVAALTDR